MATDVDGQIIFANTSARRHYRFLGTDLTRVGLAEGLLPEGDHVIFEEIAAEALSGRHWVGRLDVHRVDGSHRAADVTCSPLRHDGATVGMVCVVDDSVGERGEQRESRQLQDRLTYLARVVAELGTAEDAETVTEVVTVQAADAVGATVSSVSVLVDDNTLGLVAMRGGRSGAAQRWASFPLTSTTPAGYVVGTGKPLVMTGREEIERMFPDLERAADGPRSMIALPLVVMGRTMGAITFSFPGRRVLDNAELEFFGILADSCAQALQRIRAEDEARQQAARVRFLAEASTELSTSLEYQRTLTRVARLSVPTFADWCAIDLLEDDRLHRLAVEHVDPAKVELAVELERLYPSDRKARGGAWEVIRTGKSSLVPDVTDEMLVAAARDDEHLRLTRALQLRSGLVVPLIARGRSLGVMTWVAAESGRRYNESDLAFAEDLGKRCAIAIDNSQLYSQTLEIANRLQSAVLPDLSAGVEGWEVASHYSPAGRTEVGGDFFDAIRLPDNRLVMFVGDVMGRGVSAAAAMAQMRASIRAYIADDPTPTEVLRKLDRLFATYELTQLVTLVYLVVDSDRGELRVINAGHPPPVVLRADGTVDQLPYADGAPIGVAPGRADLAVPLAPGDTVLAFTDGLIERRDEDIDAGQARLVEAVQRMSDLPLAQALDRIVDEVRDHSREDDVAALALRLTGA